MRKTILAVVLTIGTIGSTLAQLAIPGEVFADNPHRFNGRRVTIKNIQLNSEVTSGQLSVGQSSPALLNVSAGVVGTPSAPTIQPCRPPRGFSQIDVVFKGKPEFKACFFMQDAMKIQLDREMGGHITDAMISFRGDHRMGYHVSLYKLGM